MTDPDSVLNSLTREIKEIGPDGQEVMVVYLLSLLHYVGINTENHISY